MKARNILYMRKNKARKVFANATRFDLGTFLKATFELSHSRVVKNHIQSTLQELTGWQRLTA
ncbi:MAG TPA: hypothetical protein VN721_06750 [Flavipsychrobacter sp.]|jgi:hypothetical protein|nr:hypothetical protein [Flavipsychrobacter sp.]